MSGAFRAARVFSAPSIAPSGSWVINVSGESPTPGWITNVKTWPRTTAISVVTRKNNRMVAMRRPAPSEWGIAARPLTTAKNTTGTTTILSAARKISPRMAVALMAASNAALPDNWAARPAKTPATTATPIRMVRLRSVKIFMAGWLDQRVG